MTESGETILIGTSTEIHFLSVAESNTHALYTQKHQALDHRWPDLLSQMAFADAIELQGCISQP